MDRMEIFKNNIFSLNNLFRTTKHFFIILIFLSCWNVNAQEICNEAPSKYYKAIELMDSGKIDLSIKLMKELIRIDSSNIDYQYRIGYAYYLDNNIQQAIDILKKLTTRQDAFDRVFQTLGNCYYRLGQINEATDIYIIGLKKFPNSGCLNFELGLISIQSKKNEEAIQYLTKGIEGDPGYSLNYYLIAKLFLNSSNMVWGLIYGEMFMNLEPKNSLTEEMSVILYNSYMRGLKVKKGSSYHVKFAEIPEKSNRYQIPFSMIYETIVLTQIKTVKKVDIKSLNNIRTSFLKSYFSDKVSEIFPSNIYGEYMAHLRDRVYEVFPNCLFDYQNLIFEEGHLDAYNYWLLRKGDENAFIKWKDANKKKWERFIYWFDKNKLIVNDRNKFVHINY